jgi:hypothetical protein
MPSTTLKARLRETELLFFDEDAKDPAAESDRQLAELERIAEMQGYIKQDASDQRRGEEDERIDEDEASLCAWNLFKPKAGESVCAWTERMVDWAKARLPDETEQAYADRITHWLEHKQDDETQEEWVARSKAFQNRHKGESLPSYLTRLATCVQSDLARLLKVGTSWLADPADADEGEEMKLPRLLDESDEAYAARTARLLEQAIAFDPVDKQHGYGARFRQECTLEDAIEFRTFAPLGASMRVINGISLGCASILLVDTVNCVQTLKVELNQIDCFSKSRQIACSVATVAGNGTYSIHTDIPANTAT